MRLESPEGRVVPAVQSERENQEEETYAAVDREEVWISTEEEL